MSEGLEREGLPGASIADPFVDEIQTEGQMECRPLHRTMARGRLGPQTYGSHAAANWRRGGRPVAEPEHALIHMVEGISKRTLRDGLIAEGR
jgi:hypothetical protein